MEHDSKSQNPSGDIPIGGTLDETCRQAIEVCRPARFDPEGRDWQLPEVAPVGDEMARRPQLSALRLRVAAVDSSIAAAMEQAPVPEGLADRLLACLRQAEFERAGAVVSDSAEEAPAAEEPLWRAEVQGGNVRRRLSRRRWWVSGALAAAAAVCVAAWWWARPAESMDYDQLLAAANAFDNAAAPGEWNPVTKSAPNRWYSIPANVLVRATGGWKKAPGFAGRTGVAFDLVSPAGAKGTLYVVPLKKGGQAIAGLSNSPGRPQRTGGRATAAWTDGTRLYVLVVRGGERDFWSFLRPTNYA